jgi:hypothetical protein
MEVARTICAEQFIDRSDDLLIRLKNFERGPTILVLVSRTEMLKKEITTKDIKEASSLVLARDTGPVGETELSFLSARLQSVIVLSAALMRG